MSGYQVELDTRTRFWVAGILSVHVHSHMQARRCLQLAAKSSNWVNETPSLLTHVQTHARRCKRTVCTQVSHMRNTGVSPLNFCSLRRQAPDVLTFYQGEPQAPSTQEYPTIFVAGLIRLSCIRWHSCNRKCKRNIHLSILSVALTLLSRHTCNITSFHISLFVGDCDYVYFLQDISKFECEIFIITNTMQKFTGIAESVSNLTDQIIILLKWIIHINY